MAGKSSQSSNRGTDLLGMFVSGKFKEYHTFKSASIVPDKGITATGGVTNDYTSGSGVYRAHIFTSTGTFDVTELGSLGNGIEYLVVGGGGGGGGKSAQSGGGGAGGFRTNLTGHPLKAADYTAIVGEYTITIGAGGASPSDSPGIGEQGGDSEFYPTPVSYPSTARIRAVGGGGGVGYPGAAGGAGGSGGGASNSPTAYAGGVGNTADPNHPQRQGYDGGASVSGVYASPYAGGGGGGAGRIGGPDDPTNPLGRSTGGYGMQALIAGPPANPQPVGVPGPGTGAAATGYFAGGGGGGGYNATGSVAGYGGGGDGAPFSGITPPSIGQAGTESTGGGGGGGGHPGYDRGGTGGSGIVVVRYKIAELTATAKATGGYISFAGDKTIHTFTNSGDFITTDASLTNIDCLVCGGGGASGPGSSGGGGGGGVAYYPNMPIPNPSGSISVIIGAGGIGQNAPANGTSSTFHTTPSPYYLEGKGGGAGTVAAGTAGGSGGGGGYQAPQGGGPTNQASPNPNASAINYGSVGGAATGTGPDWHYAAGGGGGAGGAGTAAAPIPDPLKGQSGPGGNGIGSPTISWMPSTVGDGGYIAGGGGGGGSIQGCAGGDGGTGGGGDGYGNTSVPTPTQPYTATDGLANTGGGAGGTAGTLQTKGGSGIVLIAYPS